jgi:hypothetical protein
MTEKFESDGFMDLIIKPINSIYFEQGVIRTFDIDDRTIALF